jgi:hypothetical protein
MVIPRYADDADGEGRERRMMGRSVESRRAEGAA